MKLRLPAKLQALLLSTFVFLTVSAGSPSLAADGFSINFYANGTAAGNNAVLSGAATAGVIPVAGDNWTNVNTTNAVQVQKDNAGNALSGVTVQTTKGTWGPGGTAPTTQDGNLLSGYVDAGSNESYTVTVAGSSYLVSNVYLILSGDGNSGGGTYNDKFTAMSVNGVSYTGNGTSTVEGTGVWGDRGKGKSALAEGTNVLVVNNVAGGNIVIGNVLNSQGRGTIAGVQVENAYAGTKRDLNLAANGSWTGSGALVSWSDLNGSGSWVDSTADAGIYASIVSTVAGGGTLTIGEGDSYAVTTDAVVLAGASTSDLTISGGTLHLIGPSILRADGAGRTLTISSAISSAGTVMIDGTGTVAFGSNQSIAGLGGTGKLDIGSTTLTVGGTGNASYGGILASTATGSLIKTGTGTQALINISQFAGTNITIQGGGLTLGDSFNKLSTFNKNVTAGASETLTIWAGTNADGAGTGPFMLGNQFAGNLVIQGGVFAINNNNVAQSVNIGTGKLHLRDGSTFLIRNGIRNENDSVFSNDIFLSQGSIILRQYGSAITVISSNITGEGVNGVTANGVENSLRRTDGGTLSLTGNIDYKGRFQLEAGTTNFSGTVNLGMLYLGSANAYFKNGANVTLGSLRLSEGSNTNSEVTVEAGSTLTISGTDNSHTTLASFLLNHWVGTSKFNVAGGTVHAEQLWMKTAWSGTSITTVTAGSLNVGGIDFWAQLNNEFKGKVFLGTNADGSASNETATGRINVGSFGIANLKNTESEAQLVLGRGTLGALANWSTNTAPNGKTITLLSALGTIFDTQDVNDSTKGYQITINHDLTGAGRLIKNGLGTLVLNGTASDFTGGIELNKGTLSVVTASMGKAGSRNLTVSGTGTGDATPLLLARDGNLALDGLAMGDGARLNLGGLDVANTLSVSNSVTLSNATLVFSRGDLINVTGNLTATGTLNFEMSLAGYTAGDEITLGSVSGNISNLFITNTVVSSDYRSSSATVSKKADNSLIATVAGGAANLVWTSANTVWDLKGDANWQGGDDHKFWQGDNVTFGDIGVGGDKTIQVSGSVLPGRMMLTNETTNYRFEGGSITVTGGFTKTGAGLWVLGTGSSLTIQSGFSMEKNTLGLDGGTLNISAPAAANPVDLGILQGVTSGSTLNFGSGKVIVGVKDAGSFANLTLVGTGALMAGGTHALDISGVAFDLYAGTTGLNITGNTVASAGNLAIYGGSWDAQTAASGTITIGAATGGTILDFGTTAVRNKGGIIGAAANIGDGTGITATSVIEGVMTNISLVGTLSGTGDAMTSNTKITGKIYGGGIDGTSIYGSTSLSLNGVHIIGGTSEFVDQGQAVLVAGSGVNANIYGNVSMNVNSSLVDSFVFGTAGMVTGDVNLSFSNSVFKKNVYGGGYGSTSLIKGDITLTAENTTFNSSVCGGRDGAVEGSITLSLKNSTVTGNVYGGYSVAGENKAKGGVDVILDGTTVGGMAGIGAGSAINGDSSLTVKGNSNISTLWGVGAQGSTIKGNALIDIQGGIIGEGKNGVDDQALLVAGRDSKIDGNATLKVSNNAHIKYGYIIFGGFGGTGITGDAALEVTGGTVESTIMGGGSWGNKIGGNFNMLLSGGTFGKDGVQRGIIGGTAGVNPPADYLVEGNVKITLDGGTSGLGATFLGGATGSNYYIYAGSVANNVKGNTLVTLSNVSQKAADGIAGVANFKGVISGANDTGGGVTGAERKLVFDNYTTEVNAQFKHFTAAEVKNASNVTLKGTSTSIGTWTVTGASTLTLDDLAKLGGATSLLIDDAGSTVNLALAADASLSTNLLSGLGTFALSGSHVLTVSADNSGFNGIMKVDGGTLRIADNGVAGSATAEINVTGGTLDVTGTSKSLAQKLTGNGTLTLNMATADAQASLSNTGSTFGGTMTLTKGILDVAAGSSLSGVNASLAADASLKLHDADLSRFAGISGAGNLVIDGTSSHTGDSLANLTGKLSVTNSHTFTLTKASAASSTTLNAGLTISLGNESNLVLVNGSGSLWDQTVKDVINQTGSSNITLSGAGGVTLRITGSEWKSSNSLNFTLNDAALYKVFVDTKYAGNMLTNVTLTDADGVNNVVVDDDGLLAAFTNYIELPVASGSSYNSKGYYIVSGVNGVNGATVVDPSIAAIGIRGMKVSASSSADQPGKFKNTSFNLGSATLSLGNGTLLFDGNTDYSISGGTIIGSSSDGLLVNTASNQLTISSVVDAPGNGLNKDGLGRLNLSNTLKAATVSVNAGTLALSGSASADDAAMTVKKDAFLILGNTDGTAYQSGLNSVTNAGTVSLLEGAALKSTVTFANNGSLNYNIGEGKAMTQTALTGTGTVSVKSGTLNVGPTALSVGQSYDVEAGAFISFDTGNGAAFAAALSGMGNVSYKGGTAYDEVLANVTNFGGKLTLTASDTAYRLKLSGTNAFKAGATIVVENNAQFWDTLNAANARNYNLVLTGIGQETRGALRIANGAVYDGTISIVGERAGIGGASDDSATINAVISSKTKGVLDLGPTGSSNGIGTVTLTGNNVDLAGVTLWKVNKVIASTAHALGGKLTLSADNAGIQALEFGANVELNSITGFIAGKTLDMAATTSGLTLKGSDASNLAGTISGKGGLTLQGTGVVALSGVNTYEGGTKIQGSSVVLSTNASALGTGAVALDSGSLNAGGLAVTNAMTAKTAASMSGMGAYNGSLTVSSSNPATVGTALLVDGGLRSATLTLTDSSARIQATGNVTIANGGSFVLDTKNAYDAATNPNAIVQSGGTVTIGGEFTLTFDTNLKSGVNEFKLFSGTFAAGNTATARLLYNDEYLKAFFTLDSSAFASKGSIFITRNTPEGYFVNQAEVDAMTDGYQGKTDVALGAKASGTAENPVNFNKDYHLADNSYRFMNGEGWLNVQTRLEGAGNKVIVYEYLPQNGADSVTDDRGVIFSNNGNTFGGGLMINNSHVIVDGSLAADASGRPIASGVVNILGTGEVALGGNKAVLELRPLGAGNTDSFTIGNNISLRDGATIEQTGGQNKLSGSISIVAGTVTLKNGTQQEMILSGSLNASANTILNMDGTIVLDAGNMAGKGLLNARTVSLHADSEFVIRHGANAAIDALNGADGAVSVQEGSFLNLGSANHEVGTLEGNGSLTLNKGSLKLGDGNTLDLSINGNGSLKLTDGATLMMGESGILGSGVMLELGDDNLVDLDGHTVQAGGVTGSGTIAMNDGTLVITGASSAFKGDFAGAGTLEQASGNTLTLTGSGSSDVNLKATAGEIVMEAPEGASSVNYGDLSAAGGTLTISSNASVKSLSIGSGSVLTLGSTELNNQKTPISLSVAGNASLDRGATINCIIPSGTPQLTSTGTIRLTSELNVNLVDNMSGTFGSPPATFVLMQANGGFIDENSAAWADGTQFKDWKVSIQGSLALFYSIGSAYIDGNRVKADAVRNVSNLLEGVARSSVAQAGAALLWRGGMQEEGTNLRMLLDSVMNDVDSGNNASASHSMAAAAGSTITSLVASQKEGFRQQQLAIRNRTAQMGVNQSVVNEEMPYFNMWMQGNGGYSKLDTQGDESGYTLSSWGGTVGFDVDMNEYLTFGAAFTANYGKLKARAADIADGDNDAYYVNLFARTQYKKWSHTLILTGGWNDASLDRTVSFNGGSYKGHGTTNGSGYGAMYEVGYDIALNEEKTSVLQPLFNASIVSTKMDDYDELGAGNAGLRVGGMDMTTGTFAAGVRWMGLVGSNLFGRESLGELRVNIAQDVGDRKGTANVGFLGNPGFMQTVKGRKIGMTGIQAGVSLSVPVGQQGSVYVDGNTDFRSGATTVGGTLGYRYNF